MYDLTNEERSQCATPMHILRRIEEIQSWYKVGDKKARTLLNLLEKDLRIELMEKLNDKTK